MCTVWPTGIIDKHHQFWGTEANMTEGNPMLLLEGLDLHLASDRLVLSVDLFDTLFSTYPRLQGRASLAVVGRTLYVVGGVDDILNSRAHSITGGGLDFFLGGQLLFNDEDLKSLLLFGGGAAAGSSK